MSHINGEGFGSTHNWHRGDASPFKSTQYRCLDCNYRFNHRYDEIPNIFDAMQKQGVPALCVSRKERE